MVKKSFITDCEGPLSLNDNAYEISAEFIPDGDEFFRIISLFDDYLVDIVKKKDYNAGNTLKLISPFFKAYDISNEDIVKFSKKNICLLKNAPNTLVLAKTAMNSFIVSTSYGQYIEAICNHVDFPLENTYFTVLDLDSYEISNDEKKKLLEFKEIILEIAKKEMNENVLDVDKLNKIFFEEIPKMNISKLTDSVVTVGGTGKQKALEDILSKLGLDEDGVMYVGDSHTDIEPLKFAKENGGIAISFNGNKSAIKEAEIAIISENTIATSILVDLHSKFNKKYMLEFIKSYNTDTKRAFESFRIGFALIEEFNEIFEDKELPIIEIITENNIKDLTSKSLKMRKKIRGENIGSLG